MTTSISKRTLAILAAVLLACALGVLALAPQSAHAAQAGDTQLTAQASDAQLATQATSSIYVRANKGVEKYAYNKKGLIASITNKSSGIYTYKWKLKYSGTKLVRVSHMRDDLEEIVYSIKYDKKDRVKSITVVSEGMPIDLYNHTETFYYNNKNQVTKKVTTYTSGSSKTSVKYAYNAKGLVSKSVLSNGTKNYMKYDSKGNRTSFSTKYPESLKDDYHKDYVYRYKNTYKNGRLVKIGTSKDGGTYYYQTIKYNKKSINKKYASAVKAQQKDLLQDMPNSMISLIS